MNRSPDVAALEIRSQGESLKDSALVELDILSGEFIWANAFYLENLRLGLVELRGMTVFDVWPPSLHKLDGIAEKNIGSSHSVIWPTRVVGSDKVLWWYVNQSKTILHRQWAWMDLIQETDSIGPGFAFMRVQMTMLNAQVKDRTKLDELETWAQSQIDKLSREVSGLRKDVTDANRAARFAAVSSEKAQRASEEAKEEVTQIRSDVERNFRNFNENLSNHEAEIMRLISSDIGHDKRIEAFEEHTKKTTELAIEAIRNAARDGSRGLSRKVTIPVGFIAAISTVIQWILSR